MFGLFGARKQKSGGFLGKVVEFNFGDFFVYGHCTHDLGKAGQILKLFKPMFDTQIRSTEALAEVDARTVIKFPLNLTRTEHDVNLVGELAVSDEDAVLPKFKSRGLFAPGETANGWWITHGKDKTWVEELSEEMSYFPNDGIPNLALIRDLYEQDLYSNSEIFLRNAPLAFKIGTRQ